MQTTVSISLAYHDTEDRAALEDIAVYVERNERGELTYRVIGLDLGRGEIVRLDEIIQHFCELKLSESETLKTQIGREWNDHLMQAAE